MWAEASEGTMAVRRRGRALAALVLAAACASAGSQPVSITSVSPSRGSLAGGTRMVIRGEGFSTNTGGGESIPRVRGVSGARRHTLQCGALLSTP